MLNPSYRSRKHRNSRLWKTQTLRRLRTWPEHSKTLLAMWMWNLECRRQGWEVAWVVVSSSKKGFEAQGLWTHFLRKFILFVDYSSISVSLGPVKFLPSENSSVLEIEDSSMCFAFCNLGSAELCSDYSIPLNVANLLSYPFLLYIHAQQSIKS